MYACGAPAPFKSWASVLLVPDPSTEFATSLVRFRLALCGLPLLALLLLMLTPLLVVHIYLAAFNLTTREQIHWLRRSRSSAPPFPPLCGLERSKEWDEYAPYDRGPIANLHLFVRGQRDEPPGAADDQCMASSSSLDVELGSVSVGTENPRRFTRRNTL